MKNKNYHLAVRVPQSVRSEFIKKSLKFGGTSEVLRDLIQAFLDDRLTIQPPPPKEIYNVI